LIRHQCTIRCEIRLMAQASGYGRRGPLVTLRKECRKRA